MFWSVYISRRRPRRSRYVSGRDLVGEYDRGSDKALDVAACGENRRRGRAVWLVEIEPDHVGNLRIVRARWHNGTGSPIAAVPQSFRAWFRAFLAGKR